MVGRGVASFASGMQITVHDTWDMTHTAYITGKLFSVSPGVVRMIQGLFVLNERIVMLGQWEHGFFSTTAVGATNVGSIQLAFDEVASAGEEISFRHIFL